MKKKISAAEKLSTLEAVDKLRRSGKSQRAACSLIGVRDATVSKWRTKFAEGGLAALKPQFHRSGRKPKSAAAKGAGK
jgi:transposase